MINLDEAIQHCEEVANANERLCETVHPAMQLSDYGKCAEEHRQLAEWLKELKVYREQDSAAISKLAMNHILNHEVKWINERMTREKAIEIIECGDISNRWGKDGEEVEKMAVKAIEQQPCDDAISRQAVMEHYSTGEIANCHHISRNNLLDFIEQLPSVTPQQRIGRWKFIVYDANRIGHYECSECHWNVLMNVSAYCPHCGAKMEVQK